LCAVEFGLPRVLNQQNNSTRHEIDSHYAKFGTHESGGRIQQEPSLYYHLPVAGVTLSISIKEERTFATKLRALYPLPMDAGKKQAWKP
jgi:hypothetical protein